MEVEYLLNSLKILENIKVGEKLSISFGKLTIDSNPNRLFRWLSGNGKYISLEHITDIIYNSIDLHLPIPQCIILSLENLKTTYHKSQRMTLRLKSLQDVIKNNV